MSWKASGYVKELREGLTVSEKFVLLVLADYHRTDVKMAWPSVYTLAADCLMTERGVQQILSRLIDKEFIVRTNNGGGRGNVGGYLIVGVDPVKGEPETLNGCAGEPQTLNGHAVKGERNPAQPANAIRKEPVEPVEPSKHSISIPDWIPKKSWDGFLEMRKRIRVPLTEHATHLLFGKLEKLRAEGMSVEEVLDQSTVNGWRGVFPVKKDNSGGSRHEEQLRKVSDDRAATREILRRNRSRDQPGGVVRGSPVDDIHCDEQAKSSTDRAGDDGPRLDFRVIR